jgi:hypothetical protein
LDSGREISMTRLAQARIYAGVLEGLPTRQGNQQIMQATLDAAHADGRAVYLVRPHETPIELDRVYPFGEPARLPGVQCVADFVSREDAVTASYLTLIWYQDDFAFPVSAARAAVFRRDADGGNLSA